MAQGADRLGRLERTTTEGRADRAADPRRHGRRVRLDKKATAISLLVVIGVRDDGQKVLLAVKRMGGETTDAWRAVLDDLTSRGLRRPQFVIVDGGAGLANLVEQSTLSVSRPPASLRRCRPSAAMLSDARARHEPGCATALVSQPSWLAARRQASTSPHREARLSRPYAPRSAPAA